MLSISCNLLSAVLKVYGYMGTNGKVQKEKIKFKVCFLLGAHRFCTIIKSTNPRLNYLSRGPSVFDSQEMSLKKQNKQTDKKTNTYPSGRDVVKT